MGVVFIQQEENTITENEINEVTENYHEIIETVEDEPNIDNLAELEFEMKKNKKATSEETRKKGLWKMKQKVKVDIVTINDDGQNQSTLSLNDTLVGPDIEEIVIKKKRKRNMRDEVSSDAMSTNSSPMKKRKRKDDHNVDVEHTQDTEC